MRGIFSTLFVSLSAAVAVSASGHGAGPNGPSWRRAKHAREHVQTFPIDMNVTSAALEKRFNADRFTFYDAGLGACGKYNSNADYVRARLSDYSFRRLASLPFRSSL